MFGKMVVYMKGSGVTTKCMVVVSLHGLMEEYMKANIIKIRNREEVHINGLMGVSIMALGIMETNMEKVCIQHQMEKRKKENGGKESESNGYKNFHFKFNYHTYTLLSYVSKLKQFNTYNQGRGFGVLGFWGFGVLND